MSNWSHKPNGKGQPDFGRNEDTTAAVTWVFFAFIAGLIWFGMTR